MKIYFLQLSKKLYFRIAFILFPLFFLIAGIFNFSSNYNIKEYLKENAPNFYKNFRDEIIYPVFRQPVLGNPVGDDIPEFKLILSRRDIAHFSELYRRYEAKGGQNYYNQNNVWKKAELFFKGKKYKIKIKSHGKNPTGHRVGKYISFLIDLRGNHQIYNTNRFSLIIHERIDPRYSLTKDMASRFNLFIQKQKLINLKINNWEEKLYFFEHRLNSSFMEANANSSLKLFSYDVSDQEEDKSLILAEKKHIKNFNPLFHSKMLKESIEEGGITKKNVDEILKRYLALNEAIVNGNPKEIASFFDEEYISSFNVVRLILGYIGHGFSRDNLYVFFNIANGKFYPILTRDNVPDYLSNNGMIENKINSWKLPWNTSIEIKLALFHLLSQNDYLRQVTYKKLFDFIKQEDNRLPDLHKRRVVELQKFYYLGWLKEFLRIVGIGEFKDITKKNFSILKQYLKNSKPQINLTGKGDKLLISIEPKSMSGLAVKKLLFQLPLIFANRTLKFTRHSWFESNKKIMDPETEEFLVQVSPTGQVSLNKALYGSIFFDGLDRNSLPLKREYKILLNINQSGFEWEKYLTKKNFEIGLLNQVTGELLTNNTLRISDKTSRFELIPPKIQFAKNLKGKNLWKKEFPRAYKEEKILKIPEGKYFISKDLVFPKDSTVVLNAGAEVYLGGDVGILIKGSLIVEGEKDKPVIIKAKNPKIPFGTVAVLGTGKESSKINFLKLSNGSEKWMNGAYFSGALSIHYQKEVEIKNSEFSEGHADDGINIKFSKVNLRKNVFYNNYADQVDLDFCKGIVRDSNFLYEIKGDNNGDGLDISGSQIIALGNLFSSFNDKGISVGEKSKIYITKNRFYKNNVGSAVKDSSNAYFRKNNFSQNQKDIQVYQKKNIFGGASIFLNETMKSKLLINSDRRSQVKFLPKDFEKDKPWIQDYSENIFENFSKLKEIEN